MKPRPIIIVPPGRGYGIPETDAIINELQSENASLATQLRQAQDRIEELEKCLAAANLGWA